MAAARSVRSDLAAGSAAARTDIRHLDLHDRAETLPPHRLADLIGGDRDEPWLEPVRVAQRPSFVQAIGHALWTASWAISWSPQMTKQTRAMSSWGRNDPGERRDVARRRLRDGGGRETSRVRQLVLHALQMLLTVQVSHPGVEIGGPVDPCGSGSTTWVGQLVRALHLERWSPGRGRDRTDLWRRGHGECAMRLARLGLQIVVVSVPAFVAAACATSAVPSRPASRVRGRRPRQHPRRPRLRPTRAARSAIGTASVRPTR